MNNTQRYRALAPIRFDYRISPDAPVVEFKLKTFRGHEKEGTARGENADDAWQNFVNQITRVMRVMLAAGPADNLYTEGKSEPLRALPIPRYAPGRWAEFTIGMSHQGCVLH